MAGTEAVGPSDAIVVGEDWISEHYFTTDATKESFKARVLARRKEWDQAESSPRSRLTSSRVALLNEFSTLDPEDGSFATRVGDLNKSLVALLGFGRLGLDHKTDGPVTFVRSSGLTDRSPFAIVDALPGESIEVLLGKGQNNLAVPFEVDESTQVTSVARLLSTLFTNDDYKPDFVLVLAGPHALVAERERWPEGRYLAIDLQLVCERADTKNGGEIDRALTCLDEASLAPNAEGDVWWTETLAESVKHTVGVSKDLREGVRLSIEIIANEVVRRRAAQGLEPLPAAEAQPLAKQSLRFLYRILFLLYAEASPELGVLPTRVPEYDRGYSLDRMRELVHVDLPTQRSQAGTHFYDSLALLFRLVDSGKPENAPVSWIASGAAHEVPGAKRGLGFQSLRADLFKPEATALISEVQLGNAALQEVLRHLLLSKEARGKDRGFISYAELGINQLGAVYEGLMSYTGFFAETDLYEVAKDGNSEKGSWVVPVDRAFDIADKDYVTTTDETTGEVRPVIHSKGAFVFRLAGRERQQSASYYTPEVLTRFVVSQALEELLDQDGKTTTAAEILELTICEPALGSGAFAIEAVRQLADQYLKRRQAETGETVPPEDYPRELQKVKAYLALHQTYGVDLNATAVELAEISLWLDTMVEGLEAPWFGLHLRRGNSLIGARKAVFTRKQVEDKSWLKAVPKPVVAGSDSPDEAPSITGRIPHFLLPADGWGAAADVGKDIKDLVPDAVKNLKDWRKSVRVKPTKKQVDQLVGMGERVERLWEFASKRLEIANQQIRRDIGIWDGNGPKAEPVEASELKDRIVTREEIEASLADPDGAYQRLKLVMDAWCALWFWPLTDTDVKPPTLDEWFDALDRILGRTGSARSAKAGDATLATSMTWDDLGQAEELDLNFANALLVEDVKTQQPWLRTCSPIASRQGFFHWELEFSPAFGRGGFDLQVGNPPWVRPIVETDALLAEGDPWWQLAAKPTQTEIVSRKGATLQLPGIRSLLIDGTTDVVCTAASVGAPQMYPFLRGLQPDLYRCFIERTWSHSRTSGTIALIHPESHFTDEKAGLLRAESYGRLRRHWQFLNELVLFEIDHHVSYGVHVYGAKRDQPEFLMASSLYHPDTVVRSLEHNGDGEEPGLKNVDGGWDLRPHQSRVLSVSSQTLITWHALLETASVPVNQTRMVFSVNQTSAAILAILAGCDRLGSLSPEFSAGWHEKGDRAKGYFEGKWMKPDSWNSVILQGPHFHVGVPFNKSPNETMANNLDWSAVDLEDLKADAVPVTCYQPAGSSTMYDRDFTHWGEDGRISARAVYRIAWREMAAITGERTLIPVILPPGPAHVHAVNSLGISASHRTLAIAAGVMSSLVADFSIRVGGKGHIPMASIRRLPFPGDGGLGDLLALRILRLNCLTNAYAELWNDVVGEIRGDDEWAGGINYEGRSALAGVPLDWESTSPLRRASDRRQALLEIDVLVAMMVGISVDDLCAVYRTQFAVLYGYDRNKYIYDANGREVPNSVLTVWRKKGDSITEEERQAVHPGSGITYTYELPFVTLDREADMRQAYAHFERVLAERQSDG